MQALKGMSRQGMITAAVLALIVFGFLFGLVGPAVLGTGGGLLGSVWTRVSGGLTESGEKEVRAAVEEYADAWDFEGTDPEAALRRVDGAVSGETYWMSPAGKEAQQVRAVLDGNETLSRDLTLDAWEVIEASRGEVRGEAGFTYDGELTGYGYDHESRNELRLRKVDGEWMVAWAGKSAGNAGVENLSSFELELLETRAREYVQSYVYRGQDPEKLYAQLEEVITGGHWEGGYGQYLKSDEMKEQIESGDYYWNVPALKITDYEVEDVTSGEDDDPVARVEVEYRIQDSILRHSFYLEKVEGGWKTGWSNDPYLVNPAGPLEGDGEQGAPRT